MGLLAVGESVEDMVNRGSGQGVTPITPELGNGSNLALAGGLIQLVVVVLLIAAVVYLLIKFLGMRTNGSRLHPLMRTVSVHPVSVNRSIQLISLEDRIYVVGVGDDVTLLDVIADHDFVELIKANAPVSTTKDLPAWLMRLLPMKKAEPEQELAEPAFHDALQSKLQQLREQRKKIQEWDPDNK